MKISFRIYSIALSILCHLTCLRRRDKRYLGKIVSIIYAALVNDTNRNVFTFSHCQIIITSYQLLSNMVDDFSRLGKWHYVVLDEGHLIKNPNTKTSEAVNSISSGHRLLLTGLYNTFKKL